jgi:hypothetical protein
MRSERSKDLRRRSRTRTGFAATGFLVAFVVPLQAVGLLGCCGRSKPFAESVTDVDEKPPQAKAYIRLSQPQVFTREALINDRLREVEHLQAGLREANWSLPFTPQLRRDLSNISALSSQLGISFNPASAMAFAGQAQALELQGLAGEIEAVRLRAELARVQRELDALRAGTGAGPAAGSTSAPAPPSPTAAPPGPSAPDVAKVRNAIDDLADSIAKVHDKIQAAARASGVSQSPEEHYTDLSAFRSRLRADLAATSLDDAHDLEGNGLYRLQFRASLLPGAQKNRFGATQVSVKKPALTDDRIRELFAGWLAHATSRLNLLTSGGEIVPNLLYERLGRSTTIFDVAEIPVATPKRKGKVLWVATRSGERSFIESVFDPRDDRKRKRDAALLKPAPPALSFAGGAEAGCPPEKAGTQPAAYATALEYLRARPTVETFVRGLEAGVLSELPERDRVRRLLAQRLAVFDELVLASIAYLEKVDTQTESCRSPREIIRARTRQIPGHFCDILLGEDRELSPGPTCNIAEAGEPARGDVYAYAAYPLERAQRVSTLASAANSMRLALALSAAVPQAGAGVEAGSDYVKSAVGKVDALERVPRVVGFARGISEKSQEEPLFGWVFGPRLLLDPKENQLEPRQTVSTEDVMVDLSVPAWWPELRLEAESAWVANWYDGEGVIGDGDKTSDSIDVKLPLGPASFDVLSDLLFQEAHKAPVGLGLRQTRIYAVTPGSVKGCDISVTFLVKGSNLWRDPKVFLRGQPQQKLEVLPDMTGLAATFSIGSLPRDKQGEDRLRVVTRNGTDSFPISVDRKCPVRLQAGTTLSVPQGATVVVPEGR